MTTLHAPVRLKSWLYHSIAPFVVLALARAQEPLATIQAPDSQPGIGLATGSNFGSCVAISRNYAVIGEPSFQVPGLGRAGRARVYKRNVAGQWTLNGNFLGAIQDGNLGSCVAVDATNPLEVVVAVGAPTVNKAWTYTYIEGTSTWAVVLLSPPAQLPGGDFGFSIATNGLFTFVGQPNYADGYVHAYKRFPGSQWFGYFGSKTEPGVNQQGEYGYSLAMSADTLLVGAPYFHVIDGPQPSVFVSKQVAPGGGWDPEERLTYSQTLGFGKSVAIEGSRCLIGAPDATVSAQPLAGLAVSFTRSGTHWTQEHVFQAASAENGAEYGTSVALDGGFAAIGAPEALGGNGTVRVYSPAPGFGLALNVNSPTALASDAFGTAVAFDQSMLLVGDPLDNSGRGTVYGYQYPAIDCNGNSTNDLHDILHGTSLDENQDGIPDECQSLPCRLREVAGSETSTDDQLGTCVAASAARIALGAPRADGAAGVDQGEAYVFDRNSVDVAQRAKLLGSDAAAGDLFGSSISIDGEYLAVGAPAHDHGFSNRGAVYVFSRDATTNTWSFLQEILGDAQAANAFGVSVFLRGDLMFVGATGATTPIGPNRGKVYVYRRGPSNYAYMTQVYATGGVSGDGFGAAVEYQPGRLAVSAPNVMVSGVASSGRVYLFQESSLTFALEYALSPSAGGRFGTSLSLDGDRIAVGAPSDATNGFAAGRAWVFSRTNLNPPTWVVSSVVTPADNDIWDSAGTAVELAGDLCMVGSPFHDTNPVLGAGMVHFFRRIGALWVESGSSQPAAGTYNGTYGSSLAYSNGLLVVGAYSGDASGVDSGGATTVGVGGTDCNHNVRCDLCDIDAQPALDAIDHDGQIDSCETGPFCFGDGSGTPCPCANNAAAGAPVGCLNSLGVGGKLVISGTASLASDTLVLQASQMPNSLAFYYQSTAQSNGGLGLPIGDGLSCLGSIIRLGSKTNVGGSSSYPQAGDLPVSVKGAVFSVGIRYYQVRYRNAADFCTADTTNWTNAFSVLWAP